MMCASRAFLKESRTLLSFSIGISITWVSEDYLMVIAHIIHKHSYVLYSSDRGRNVFKNLLLVAYRHC